MRTLSILILLGGSSAGGSPDGGFDAGVRAYREGRFADALAAFAAAEQDAGDAASPVLLYDLALAALRVGDLSKAEAAAEKAAERGGDDFAPRRDFVRGSVAYARAQSAGAQADGVEAEPFAFEAAIALARRAAQQWQHAACSKRADWPQARRNVERALQLVDDLERRKAAAEAKRKRQEPDQAKPKPVPPPDAKPPDAKDVPPRPLDLDAVRRLFDRLAAKEKEKLILRRRVAAPSATAGANDW
ncbi:MAG: hypothetical protein R3F56_23670 [Planctomycetota bacterium]